MSQEQQAMKQQEALKDMLAMAQREQQGEKVSVEEVQAFVTKNKDILPPEMITEMQKNVDIMKAQTAEMQGAVPAQPTTTGQTAPAADAAPSKFNDSAASERAMLEQTISQKYSQREMANNQREAIKGKNTMQSAVVGGVSAGGAMMVLHSMFNDKKALNNLLKNAKGAIENGQVSDSKLSEVIGLFTKGLGDKFNETDQFKTVKDNLKDFLVKDASFAKSAMQTDITSAIKEGLDTGLVDKLKDPMVDLTKTLADQADKVSRLTKDTKIADELGEFSKSVANKLKPLVEKETITQGEADSFVSLAAEKVKSFSEQKREFETTGKDAMLEGAKDLSKKVVTEGKKFGDKAQPLVKWFNELNPEGTKFSMGGLKQAAVVSSAVAITALVVAGIDSALKSGNDSRKAQLTSEIRNFDKEIAEDKVKLTSFVKKYANEAAGAERSTSFADKVQTTEGKNNIVKTDGSFGDKIRAEQTQEQQSAGISI
jgi:hypothetical protein